MRSHSDAAPTPDSGSPLIELRGISKQFGETIALDRFDLAVPAGSTTALLGLAGSGKSTALRVLAGLVRPQSGTATLHGQSLTLGSGPDARARLGFCDADPRFHDWMTGREVLAYAADLAGVAREELAGRVEGMLDRVGLAGDASARVGTYSAVARRRLGIGQALINRPDVLLLDDPLGALDPDDRAIVADVVARARSGDTVLMATRSLADAEQLADRVALLDRGRLIWDGPADDFLARFATPTMRIAIAPSAGLAMAGLASRLEGVAWTGAVAIEESELQLQVQDFARADVELIPAIVASGLRIEEVVRDRPSLDEVVARVRDALA